MSLTESESSSTAESTAITEELLKTYPRFAAFMKYTPNAAQCINLLVGRFTANCIYTIGDLNMFNKDDSYEFFRTLISDTTVPGNSPILTAGVWGMLRDLHRSMCCKQAKGGSPKHQFTKGPVVMEQKVKEKKVKENKKEKIVKRPTSQVELHQLVYNKHMFVYRHHMNTRVKTEIVRQLQANFPSSKGSLQSLSVYKENIE